MPLVISDLLLVIYEFYIHIQSLSHSMAADFVTLDVDQLC